MTSYNRIQPQYTHTQAENHETPQQEKSQQQTGDAPHCTTSKDHDTKAGNSQTPHNREIAHLCNKTVYQPKGKEQTYHKTRTGITSEFTKHYRSSQHRDSNLVASNRHTNTHTITPPSPGRTGLIQPDGTGLRHRSVDVTIDHIL